MIAKPVLNSIWRQALVRVRRNSSTTDVPRRVRRRRWPIVLAVLAGAVTLAACAAFETVDYYWQGAAGQWDLIARSQPIPDVIGKSDAALAARLQRIREIRAFASRELGSPGQRQLYALHRSRPAVRHVERVRHAGAFDDAAAVVLSRSPAASITAAISARTRRRASARD